MENSERHNNWKNTKKNFFTKNNVKEGENKDKADLTDKNDRHIKDLKKQHGKMKQNDDTKTTQKKDGVSTATYGENSMIEIQKEKERNKCIENENKVATSEESAEAFSTENEYEEEKEETETETGTEETEIEETEEDRQKREDIKELADICIEKNMPVTKENIQIVKKIIERLKLEERINKNENIKSLHEKRKILEEIEFHEWADREKRIKELQEKKMKLLKKIIEDRDTVQREKIFYEVEKVMQKRDEDKDKIIEDFNMKKARDMRNLFAENKKTMQYLCNTKNDTIDEMNDYTSNYHLQLERNGRVPNTLNASYSNRIDNLITLKNLNKLEDRFDANFLKSPNFITDTTYRTNTKHTDKKNKQMINVFNRYLNKTETKQTISSSNYFLSETDTGIQTKTQYMKTQVPNLSVTNEEEEWFEQKVLFLQNALRGKALKKVIRYGINSYGDLIEELKTRERIDKYSNEKKILFEKENFDSIKIDTYVDNLQGKYVSEMLDKLSSELEKYEEERKIAVMVKYAERERRLKECKEKGKRQAEILLREKEDYLFSEIMGLNNQTVDSYLEDILGKTITDVSKEEALIRTKQKAEKLNDIYNSLENTEENNKLIIKDLVGNFIIPYVDEHRGLEIEKLEQQKKEYVSNFATQSIMSKVNETI